ncbi:putative polynucleotide 5'-hydroxyl-kinase [Helianthus annuus]|nr:putative polynucleotide 5'-hydroxyl-kinase [Helianthus annuus]KAJ0641324.1 putative polynucleotide 5'-hydroxyl-kinase [Helianthus annuus]KAJ0645228.1 putative polynucleotide 5'-hydroxyl-kinase [Helianthus annuus]
MAMAMEEEAYIPEEWSEAAATIASASASGGITAFICGPKNSGKSTFSRHLLQLLLPRHKRVAYLDSDVGQPEFTPPGCLSLTILDSEATGIGYDVLVDMLNHIAPSHVVNIRISAKSKNLPSGAFWSQDGDARAITLLEINSARQDSLNRSVLVHKKDSSHMRDLSIVTYFRQCFCGDMNMSSIKEIALALAAHSPYEVSVSAVNIKHLHCEVPKAEIFYSLNASIVGLAVNSEGSEHPPRCVGLGIVRGIDTWRRVLYIITPVPSNVLEEVDVLLQGFIQIPACLLQVHHLRLSFSYEIYS